MAAAGARIEVARQAVFPGRRGSLEPPGGEAAGRRDGGLQS